VDELVDSSADIGTGSNGSQHIARAKKEDLDECKQICVFIYENPKKELAGWIWDSGREGIVQWLCQDGSQTLRPVQVP
jgi:hypothetical protein